MQFGFLGINYKNANLSVRGKISFTDIMKLEFFQKAEAAGVEQCMVLSTCNRSEVFFFYSESEEEQRTRIREIYEEMFAGTDLDEYLAALTGQEAAAYLFRIAAGLESLVPGEDQILGQVKEALDYSRTMGYCGKELDRVVRDAVSCAKRIKTELKISEKPLSVSYVGIKKLEETCGIAGKRVLIIGSGNTAALALTYVYEFQDVQVMVCSRNYSHTKKLCEKFPEMQLVYYEKRYDILDQCDIVISATSSPHLVIKREHFSPVRPLVFLDLAAPRDIDTAFAEDALVQLIDLDTLQEIVHNNKKEREYLLEASRQLLEEKLRETSDWLLHSRVDDTIASLQQRCQTIAADSYAYLNRKMELSQREQKLLKKVLNASLQRLLREPIKELKRLDTRDKQEQYKQLMEQLFQLN